MQKFFLVSVFVFSFGSLAAAENYSANLAFSEGLTLKNNTSVRRVAFTPQEIAAQEKEFSKAAERDRDLTEVFSQESFKACEYPQAKFKEWLIQNKDVIVDRKEYPAPAVIKSSEKSSVCSTSLVVHYHKITTKEMKKK